MIATLTETQINQPADDNLSPEMAYKIHRPERLMADLIAEGDTTTTVEFLIMYAAEYHYSAHGENEQYLINAFIKLGGTLIDA